VSHCVGSPAASILKYEFVSQGMVVALRPDAIEIIRKGLISPGERRF
jgi:hypothetical protein